MKMTDPWDHHAAWWRENFTEGADPEYEEQILPLVMQHLQSGGTTLDLGCGEGHLARLAALEKGCSVVGVDPAHAQVLEARERGGTPRYAQGSAVAIPVADGSVDAVVSCLVFEHVADLEAALEEVARVLRPGGRFLLLLNHPVVQTPGSGWVDDHMVDPPEQYWQLGPYLTAGESVEQVDPGVFLTFHHRPLSHYLNSAIDRGLDLERMEEPPPPAGFIDASPEYFEQATMPRLLFLRFSRR